MPTDNGKLSKLIAGQSGYFRTDCSEFPWHSTDRSVWYALLVVEDGEIVRYGFTSSKSSKQALCDALESLAAEDEALLLGIWTGQWSTHLFVLEPATALEHLRGKKIFSRFDHLRDATDVTKVYGPRGGFRYLSYCYLNEHGTPVHTSTGDRSDAEDLETFFKEQGITIAEERPK